MRTREDLPFEVRAQNFSRIGTTNYLYDGVNLLEEIDQSGNVVARYTQSTGIDKPLAEVRLGTTSYYEQDGQGSVSSVSNSAGSIANTYTYDSYGKLTASTGTLTNPLRYAAREFDSETDLYYNRARYYDPAAGRWLSEDPIRFFGGFDFYAYVLNNPLKYRDPLGRQGEVPDCFPDCVHSQQERAQMQRDHDQMMQQVLGPDPSLPDPLPSVPPLPSPNYQHCPCGSSAPQTNAQQLYLLAEAWHMAESVEFVGLGVGVGVAGLGGGAALCVGTGAETFGAGCFGGATIAVSGLWGGYYITRSGWLELEEIYNNWPVGCP